ncbi:MAG: hypothetical protein LBN08_04935 [Lactobacillales bacterium]|jgi:tetratricopeptide (TPR) repeat protein|nr:hypothetical protein [Lactobacillales bacterium]
MIEELLKIYKNTPQGKIAKKLQTFLASIGEYDALELIAELFEMNETKKAITCAKYFSAKFNDDDFVINVAALVYDFAASQDDYDFALSILEKVEDDAAEILKVAIYRDQKLYDVALDKIKKIVRNNPTDFYLTFDLATLYFDANDIENAEATLKYLIKLRSQIDRDLFFNVINELVNIYEISKQFEELLALDELYPEAAVSDFIKGEASLYQGDADSALKLFKRVEKSPDFEGYEESEVYKNIARASVILKDFEIAVKYAKKSINATHELYAYEAQEILASALISLKRDDEAIDALKASVKNNPNPIFSALALAEILINKRDYQGALATLDCLDGEDKNLPNVFWAKGTIYRHLDEDKRAFTYFKSAYDQLQNEEEFLKEFANFSLKIGERTLAKALFDQYLAINPDDSEAQQVVEDLEAQEY